MTMQNISLDTLVNYRCALSGGGANAATKNKTLSAIIARIDALILEKLQDRSPSTNNG